MTIPFINLFKKIRMQSEPIPPPLPVRIEKPSNERMSKTVVPNSTRIVSSQDPPQALESSMPGAVDPSQAGLRMVSYTPGSTAPAVRPGDLPPAVAFALEPDVERVVAIELSDIIGQIPDGFLKPAESFDRTAKVLLKAAELEKGMSTGQPSVSLASIYQQVPEIFLHTVPLSETKPVTLPFEKVLEGFQNLRVRRDQERNMGVPQVETPFLKATLEDSETFGIAFEPLQTCETPPVRVELATAQSIAAAEPETSNRFIPTVTPVPSTPLRMREEEPLREEDFPPAKNGGHSKIPSNLPTNGTSAPPSERIPAPAGPSRNGPARIPFKVGPPSDTLRRKPKPPPEPDWASVADQVLAEGDGASGPEVAPVKITLKLKPILLGLPAFQLSGDVKDIPEDVGLEFPFSLIEPQLGSGRVALAPKVFEEMLPQQYRHLFNGSEPNAPVALPLEEVLKNLPETSLRMRDDQEVVDAGLNLDTPFSRKAEEDAKRFQVNLGPIEKPSPKAAPKAKAKASKVKVAPKAEPLPDATPAVETKFDAKIAVARAIELPGVSGCAVTFSDGLSLAGNLPEGVGAEGLCAMAPSLLHRVEDYMVDTKLGGLKAMTLHCSKSPITFFMHGNICLSALHSMEGLTSEIRDQLGRMVEELSQIYSQSEVSHVDH